MNVRPIMLLLLAAALGGCATASVSRVDADNALRAQLSAKAAEGDAEAQYQLGVSYCCGTGFYSTTEAIKWWCRAASQGHALAARKLDEHLTAERDERCTTR